MSHHRHRVLVIDDDFEACHALEELLRVRGCDVVTAADGEEGLAALRRGPTPCLVLLDLRMAGMNGWRFREEQLRDGALRDLPVAVFSGDAQEEHVAERLRVRHFLRKPVDVARLFALVDRACAAHAVVVEDASS